MGTNASTNQCIRSSKKITGLPAEKIFVYTTYLGTGLGRRAEVDFVIQALEIAKKIKNTCKTAMDARG